MNLPFQPVRAVFFDAVGTLIHPVEPVPATYRRFAARQGLMLDEPTVQLRMKSAYAHQERLDQAAGWRTDEAREFDRWQSIVRDTLPEAAVCFDELWHYFSTPQAWTVADDTAEALIQLQQRGLVLGIASNFDQRLASILPAFPALAPVAAVSIISSAIGWRKPGRGFFEEVIRQAECEPAEIMFVGDDWRNDIEGATAAGLRAVLMSSELVSTHAAVVARISDLTTLI